VFWLANRAADVPYWFTVDNERVRALPIPMPDADTRVRFARALYGQIGKRHRPKTPSPNRSSGMTHNLSLNAMADIVSLAASNATKASDIDDAVQSYRIGDMASMSPWRGGTLRESITAAETPASDTAIEKSVKGQPRAVARVLDILKRTSVGLTAAHSAGGATRPRGVLFFVGPTGVGKTEMAKTITRVVFGDATAYKRFDMSEFSAEHSGDRFIGAPPGYVGFDQGGELTNHMRERPFSVLLFDEVEKAHDRILDKFLQILEDGRLTDGRGETVYFSDALIIFTSNLGVSRTREDKTVEQLIRFDEVITPEEYKSRIMKGVTQYFKDILRRPELLNRLGENIVVFDFISEPVAREILDSMIANVKNRVQEEHGVALDLALIHDTLVRHCTTDRANGARGIGSKLEEALVNPLSRLLFAQMPTRGQTLVVERLEETNGIHTLYGHAQG
jgi:ATP-dependent Clp protease ATP-binding subunit ClpB